MYASNSNESGDVTSDTENSGGYWSFSSDYKFIGKRRSRLGRRKLFSSNESSAESSKSNPVLKDIVNVMSSDKSNEVDEVQRKLNTSFISGESSSESGSCDSRAADCSAVTDRSISMYDSLPFRTPAKSFFFDDNEPFNPLAGILDTPDGAKHVGKPQTCFKESTIMEPTQFYSPLKIVFTDKKSAEMSQENTDSKSTGSGNSEITVQPSASIDSSTLTDSEKEEVKKPQESKASVNSVALVPRTPDCKVVASPQLLAALRNSPLIDQSLFPKNLDRIDVRSALDSFLRTDSKKAKPKGPPAAVNKNFPTDEPSKPSKVVENGLSFKFLQPNQENLFFKKPITCGSLPGENNKLNAFLASNICSLTRPHENNQSKKPVSPTKVRSEQLGAGHTISPSGSYLVKPSDAKLSPGMHKILDASHRPLDQKNPIQRNPEHIPKCPILAPAGSTPGPHKMYIDRKEEPVNNLTPFNGSGNNHKQQPFASSMHMAPPQIIPLGFRPLEVNISDRNHPNVEPAPIKNACPSVASNAIPSQDTVDSKPHTVNSVPMKPMFTPQNIPPHPEKSSSSAPAAPPVAMSDNVFRAPLAPAPRTASIQQTSEKPPVLEDPKRPQDINVNGVAYTAISKLGSGGSSVVYQVIHPKTSEMLAVKCVNLKSVDKTIANGYLNEVELLSQLQGLQSVIRMYDYQYIQQQELLYVVMEKGDIDLAKLIKNFSKTKKISMAMVIYYWTEMLNAVKDIHDRGIIHSDLKPSNFLLVSGRLKLIDFGIASSLQGDTTSVLKDVMCGTFNYMSPEAISSTSDGRLTHKISLKSDVWSLGCILYNLVYGRTPYSHLLNMLSKLSAIVDDSCPVSYPSEESIGDLEIPVSIAVALRWSLNKSVKARPTVKQLLELPYYSPPAYLPMASRIKSDTYATILSMFPECNVNLEVNKY